MTSLGRRSQSSGASLTVVGAMKKGHFHLIRELVDSGCNVNERDQEARTPLILCAVIEDEKFALSAARMFIENGAKIWLRDKTGKNALMAACLNEREALIEVLLQSLDFNLNAQDKFGCTALHHCAMCGNENITKLILNRLLRYEMPILVVNSNNKTPADCALELGYFKCAEAISEDSKVQVRNWEGKRLHAEKKRQEEREAIMKEYRKKTIVRTASVTDETSKTQPPISQLETVEEGSNSTAAASHVDAVTIPMGESTNKKGSVGPGDDKSEKPKLHEALDQLSVDLDADANVTGYSPPLSGDYMNMGRTDTERSKSSQRKPPNYSTPRISTAVARKKEVTSVLKKAKERELIAKRQDFRRALSALPNRKRVRESKISTQSRKSVDFYITRPRTAISTSFVLNQDENERYKCFVTPLFEVYREHLTDSFRPSVAAIQAAAEELERRNLGKDVVEGKAKGGGAGERDSADPKKKAKKKPAPSPSGKKK